MENRQTTLAQQTVDHLIDFITAHGLKAGDKLPTEKELSTMMLVSRSAVREALGILTAMRIIKTVQGSGIYLASPRGAVMLDSYQAYMKLGYASIDEMYELRIYLEAATAELSAKRITMDGIYELELCMERSKRYIFDQRKFSEAESAFHQVISESCQNQLLIMNLRSIRQIVEQYRTITVHYLEIRKTAYEYHNKLYGAIKNHDPGMARMYMIEHLTEVKRAADFYNLFHT